MPAVWWSTVLWICGMMIKLTPVFFERHWITAYRRAHLDLYWNSRPNGRLLSRGREHGFCGPEAVKIHCASKPLLKAIEGCLHANEGIAPPARGFCWGGGGNYLVLVKYLTLSLYPGDHGPLIAPILNAPSTRIIMNEWRWRGVGKNKHPLSEPPS